MSKNVAMFVDVANMYYAARGQDVDVDYVALLKHATKGRDLIRAYAYTGLDPENENQRKFIDFLGKNGYKPVIKDIRKFGDGRMKANLDIELVVDLFRLADRMDIAVIVSGDGDFAPAIKALQDKGVRAEVISFKPNTSSDLIAVADEFTDIMKIASISRKEARATLRSMSAPEMPAKEVTPEFGFREASPSVAAAALAALKTGSTDSGRGRGRTPTRRSPAPESEEAVVTSPPAEAIADGDEQSRRRRRRRGGRGRGRGRREDEATPAAAGGEEIGWEEFDDLAQLDGAETPREYGFEEADPATLAELGLTPEEIEAMTAAEGQPAAEGAGEQEDKPKGRRRSTRAKKADADADSPAESQPAAEGATEQEDKPKGRRRSTRAKKSGDTGDASQSSSTAAEPSDSGEPQGIWGRFRSARKPREASTS
ncbi:MAG TPA: NYN domain-containing protein [Candidatus Limnocylindrales bacterium]|nr:NYN domain-containing protein [Candidatus Limnocylindrales bacterium]